MGTITDETFDPATWDELLELFGRDGVAEMIAALERDLPEQRQRLDAALQEQDRGAVRRIAHGLRGAALQFGANPLAEHCGRIERLTAGDAAFDDIARDATAMLDRQLALTRRLTDTLHGA